MTTCYMLLTMSFVEFQCFHDNVSVIQTPLLNDDAVKVNYVVTLKVHRFFPITVDIYRGTSEDFLAAYRCQNDSVVDGGANIGKVIFAGWCGDPNVIVYSNITIFINLGLDGFLSNQEQACTNVTIGPQSEYIYCTVHV